MVKINICVRSVIRDYLTITKTAICFHSYLLPIFVTEVKSTKELCAEKHANVILQSEILLKGVLFIRAKEFAGNLRYSLECTFIR